MSRNWTTEQVEAIDAKRGSILVAAAAGAGKTAVLVERIIRAITKEVKTTINPAEQSQYYHHTFLLLRNYKK